MQQHRLFFICFTVIAAGTTNFATAADDTGFYVDTDIGRVRYPADAQLDVMLSSMSLHSTTLHDAGTMWGLRAGYSFGPHVAVEAGYADFGKLTGNLGAISGGTVSSGSFDYSVRGVTLGVVGTMPVGKWEPFIRADYLLGTVRLSLSGVTAGAPFGISVSAHKSAPLLGVGVRYNIDSHWSLKLSYDHVFPIGDLHETGRASINAALLGVAYRF